MATVIDSPTHH